MVSRNKDTDFQLKCKPVEVDDNHGDCHNAKELHPALRHWHICLLLKYPWRDVQVVW